MKVVQYKACLAHGGNLIHAVPMRESDPTKVGAIAVCGKNTASSRRPVWYLVDRAVTCKKCLSMMAKSVAHTTYEKIGTAS